MYFKKKKRVTLELQHPWRSGSRGVTRGRFLVAQTYLYHAIWRGRAERGPRRGERRAKGVGGGHVEPRQRRRRDTVTCSDPLHWAVPRPSNTEQGNEPRTFLLTAPATQADAARGDRCQVSVFKGSGAFTKRRGEKKKDLRCKYELVSWTVIRCSSPFPALLWQDSSEKRIKSLSLGLLTKWESLPLLGKG